MKPENLKTKIFLDSGDPDETKEILNKLGFLDGQTTNPSLISKNPDTVGKKFSREELLKFYKGVVQEVSGLLPEGSVSVEVYADENTTAEKMFEQGKEMFSWIPNAHIKFPTTAAGLEAAERAIKEGMRVNMTLCFTQEQAAGVYAATKGAKKGDVFVSPFVGRLDDKAENGMELIKNILTMYNDGDGHVEVLTASVRSLEHFLYALQLESDIVTSPSNILAEWAEKRTEVPKDDFVYEKNDLQEISYKELDLEKDWREFDIHHDLTDKGIERFAQDWNNLIK
ncbi:transaldolase [Patescibacteria group bacterium]|nr:transaldolase [Patescibacteria group bacterium]